MCVELIRSSFAGALGPCPLVVSHAEKSDLEMMVEKKLDTVLKALFYTVLFFGVAIVILILVISNGGILECK